MAPSSFFLLMLQVSLTIKIASTLTPDCYNLTTGLTKIWYGQGITLPPTLPQNKRLDWLIIKPGVNCAFYTFEDVYFASTDP